MLTKEERNAIAERIGKEFDYTENDEVYEDLIGEEVPDATSTLGSVTYLPNQLTHTSVSETEQLAKVVKNAVDTFNEQLRDFAEFMASVGDNND